MAVREQTTLDGRAIALDSEHGRRDGAQGSEELGSRGEPGEVPAMQERVQ
jgi:hypothetical protein